MGAAYAAAFPTFEECRAAIAFRLEGLHLERIRDTLVGALPGLFKLGQAGTPAMMIEGMQDHAICPMSPSPASAPSSLRGPCMSWPGPAISSRRTRPRWSCR